MTEREKLLAELLDEISAMTEADLPAFKREAAEFHGAVRGSAYVEDIRFMALSPIVASASRNVFFDNRMPKKFSQGRMTWTASDLMVA